MGSDPKLGEDPSVFGERLGAAPSSASLVSAVSVSAAETGIKLHAITQANVSSMIKLDKSL